MTTPPTRRIPALDGLRALAAVAVVANHTTGLAAESSHFAMDCFFTLSGFLVGGLALDAVGKPHWKVRFWVRRALRIWPAYYVFCTVGSIWFDVLPPRWMLWCFLENFPHLLGEQGQLHGSAPTIAAWSIGTEEWFYLMCPLLVGACRKRRDIPIVFGVVAFFAVALRLYVLVLWPRNGATINYFLPFTRFDALSLGVIVAWIRRERPAWVRSPALWAVVVLLSLVLGRSTQNIMVTAALCLLFSLGQAGALASVMSWRPLAWVGNISYPIYLFGALIGGVGGDASGFLPLPVGWTLCLASFALTLPASWASTRFIERPVQKLGIGLLDRWLPETATVPINMPTVAEESPGSR